MIFTTNKKFAQNLFETIIIIIILIYSFVWICLLLNMPEDSKLMFNASTCTICLVYSVTTVCVTTSWSMICSCWSRLSYAVSCLLLSYHSVMLCEFSNCCPLSSSQYMQVKLLILCYRPWCSLMASHLTWFLMMVVTWPTLSTRNTHNTWKESKVYDLINSRSFKFVAVN